MTRIALISPDFKAHTTNSGSIEKDLNASTPLYHCASDALIYANDLDGIIINPHLPIQKQIGCHTFDEELSTDLWNIDTKESTVEVGQYVIKRLSEQFPNIPIIGHYNPSNKNSRNVAGLDAAYSISTPLEELRKHFPQED